MQRAASVASQALKAGIRAKVPPPPPKDHYHRLM